MTRILQCKVHDWPVDGAVPAWLVLLFQFVLLCKGTEVVNNIECRGSAQRIAPATIVESLIVFELSPAATVMLKIGLQTTVRECIDLNNG